MGQFLVKLAKFIPHHDWTSLENVATLLLYTFMGLQVASKLQQIEERMDQEINPRGERNAKLDFITTYNLRCSTVPTLVKMKKTMTPSISHDDMVQQGVEL